jgi:hypothetical protein
MIKQALAKALLQLVMARSTAAKCNADFAAELKALVTALHDL